MDTAARFVMKILACLPFSANAAEEDVGKLAGKVVDSKGSAVSQSMIVVLDPVTGLPVSPADFKHLSAVGNGKLKMVTATTNDAGEFTIDHVRPGNYRLLAQSWEDADKPVTDPLEVNGGVVRVHGWTDAVVVPSGISMKIEIRPRGSSSLNITTEPRSPNNDTLLIVSAHPLAADGILGFAAWSGPFLPRMMAFNRMPLGRTTIHGLPEGMAYFAGFANDNNPGFGGSEATLKADETTTGTLPLIASWSDGYTTPPPRLDALVEEFKHLPKDYLRKKAETAIPEFAAAMKALPRDPVERLLVVVPFLDREIDLDSGARVPLKDVMAADGYARLILRKEELAQTRKNERAKQLGIPPIVNVSYQQAFQDLHATLFKNYPCFELKQIDWPAVGQRLSPRAAEVKSDAEFGLLCLELLAALEDSHAQLLAGTADVPKIPFPEWDAGFACLRDDRDQPVVYYVAPKSNAERAGLKVGMTIRSLNNKPSASALAAMETLLRKYISYSSERTVRYDAVRLFARQMTEGANVDLEAKDIAGNYRSFSLVANQRGGYLPRLPVPRNGINDSGDVSWMKLEDGIGYLYVRRISDKLPTLLDAAVAELKESKGLILDVRGNSGGGFDTNEAFGNFNSRDGSKSPRPQYAGPIAVLLDARCISAGEGWISWFVGKPNVKMFGETTAGASARKTNYTLPNGLFIVRYPVKAYKGFLDRPIERRGIEPDVPVNQSASDLAAGRDTVLEAARQYLAKLDAERP
ncbi:MAG: S41 family peptidase [Planctomycetota bacterium]